MYSILYATDYSEASIAALHGAQMLSHTLQMRLVITHIYDVPTAIGTQLEGPFPDLRQDSLAAHRKKLEEFYDSTRTSSFEPKEVVADPVENMSTLSGIISRANQWHARLIIVGMRGENPIKELVMGSTTKKLIDKSPCPVLAVPAGHHFNKISHIIYATDFEIEDLHALEKVAELTNAFKAVLHVVHITGDKAYYGPDQMAWFKAMIQERIPLDSIHFELIESNDITSTLETYSKKLGADLICMLERADRGLTKKLFHRDLVKKLAGSNNIPLLSFNEQNLQTYFF
jgi:nucleotide-binding universal stress UspA family protein